MMAKKKLNPPFDWESWYQACGGRDDHTLQASKIVAKIYNEQALKFTGFVESTTRPFGSPDQASKFVKTVAKGAGAAAVGIAKIEPSDVYDGRSVNEITPSLLDNACCGSISRPHPHRKVVWSVVVSTMIWEQFALRLLMPFVSADILLG